MLEKNTTQKVIVSVAEKLVPAIFLLMLIFFYVIILAFGVVKFFINLF